MSKPKRNNQTPEPPPRQEHSFEQVVEIAKTLYASRPFKISDDGKSQKRCFELARQAFDFLDSLQNAYNQIVRHQILQDSEYRRAEARNAEAEAKKLPEIVPFNKAIRFITRQQRTKRAERNFKRLARYSGGLLLFGQAPPFRTLNAQIGHWRKTGIPRGEVIELRDVFDDSLSHIVGEENRGKAKTRKQWEPGRVSKTLSETAAKELRRG